MIHNPDTIEVRDDGATQGRVRTLDFTGSGVTATVSGQTATVAVAGGGGGSFSATQAIVSLPYPAKRIHRVTVTDATVSPTSKIMLSLAGVPDTQENAGDVVDLLSMQAVPGSGDFQFQASFLVPHAGALVINYAVG